MAKIQVEIGGQLQDVTKSQLFELAKYGDVTPETRLVVDGKVTKARKVQGIEFAYSINPLSGQSSAVLTVEDSPEPVSASIPVPTPKPEPQIEMTNRLLVLCLASLIPGLGHFLLGCSAVRCLRICCKTIAIAMFSAFILYFGAFLALWIGLGLPIVALSSEAFRESGGAAFVVTGIVSALLPLISPLIIGYVFWRTYPDVVADLKKEYSKRYPAL
jgi:hypothetical protein